jgi:predicted RNA-binding Zn-ribbon protein involved in translation (DUF1610 family)
MFNYAIRNNDKKLVYVDEIGQDFSCPNCGLRVVKCKNSHGKSYFRHTKSTSCKGFSLEDYLKYALKKLFLSQQAGFPYLGYSTKQNFKGSKADYYLENGDVLFTTPNAVKVDLLVDARLLRVDIYATHLGVEYFILFGTPSDDILNAIQRYATTEYKVIKINTSRFSKIFNPQKSLVTFINLLYANSMITVCDSYRIRRYNYLVDNQSDKLTRGKNLCGFTGYRKSCTIRQCINCRYSIVKDKDVTCLGFIGICDITTLEFALHWKEDIVSLGKTLRSFGKPPSCMKNKESSNE